VRDTTRDGVILKSSGAYCTGERDVDGGRDDGKDGGVGDSSWGLATAAPWWVDGDTQEGLEWENVKIGTDWPKKMYKTSSTTTPVSSGYITKIVKHWRQPRLQRSNCIHPT
jgi:hypothetical protein